MGSHKKYNIKFELFVARFNLLLEDLKLELTTKNQEPKSKNQELTPKTPNPNLYHFHILKIFYAKIITNLLNNNSRILKKEISI